MFRCLVPKIGFAWTTRAIAFVVLALYLVSYLVLFGGQKKPPMIRRLFDTSAFSDRPFMVLCIASLFSSTAYYISLLYLPLLTEVRIPGFDPSLAFDILAIVNGTSFVGRVLAGIVAAKFGPTETISVALVFGSVLLFCWIVVDSVAGTIVWSVFWGMVSGVLVALPGAFMPLFTPSAAVIGTRSGMYWIWMGLGLLIGSPIGGAIFDPRSDRTDYWRLQVFAGIMIMAAAVCTVYPILHLRRRARVVSST